MSVRQDLMTAIFAAIDTAREQEGSPGTALTALNLATVYIVSQMQRSDYAELEQVMSRNVPRIFGQATEMVDEWRELN